ncbi:MAG: TetR/AcrR family transcriptional regulator [Treponema sp.]
MQKKPTRSESKFNNSSKKMNQALLELLENKNYNEISITEICKNAGVNRSTFYSHYSTIYDLYAETYKNLSDSFFNSFDFTRETTDAKLFASEKYIVPYLEFVREHKKFYKSLVNNFESFNTDTRLVMAENVFIPIFKKRGVKDLTMIDYILKFYLNGINAIVLNWISKDCKEEISYIYKIICRCIKQKI